MLIASGSGIGMAAMSRAQIQDLLGQAKQWLNDLNAMPNADAIVVAISQLDQMAKIAAQTRGLPAAVTTDGKNVNAVSDAATAFYLGASNRLRQALDLGTGAPNAAAKRVREAIPIVTSYVMMLEAKLATIAPDVAAIVPVAKKFPWAWVLGGAAALGVAALVAAKASRDDDGEEEEVEEIDVEEVPV